jgi:hypothetical protein
VREVDDWPASLVDLVEDIVPEKLWAVSAVIPAKSERAAHLDDIALARFRPLGVVVESVQA